MNWDLRLRGTGRTKRMLHAAIGEARKGEYVIVIVAHVHQKNDLYQQLLKYAGTRPTNIETGKVYFDEGGSISFLYRDEEGFDFYSGRKPGAHPDCKIFADHYALEMECGWALQEWARWSLK